MRINTKLLRKVSYPSRKASLLVLLLAGCASSVDEPTLASGSRELDGRAVEDIAKDLGDPTTRDPDAEEKKAAYYPIVLMHGFNASADEEKSLTFYKVAQELAKDGHQVTMINVPPYNSLEQRANVASVQIIGVLNDFIKRHPQEPPRVNIIGHSMGGLDARWIASHISQDDQKIDRDYWRGKIASLTTISTPHRGSQIADEALDFFPAKTDGARNNIINALGDLWRSGFSDQSNRTSLVKALTDLSVAQAPTIARATPSRTDIFYQSFAAISQSDDDPSSEEQARIDRSQRAACGIILGSEQAPDARDELDSSLTVLSKWLGTAPNDGMVSVDSAKFPLEDGPTSRWHFRGCIRGDHLDVIGQPHHTGPTKTGFDHIRFYRNLAHDIARINEAQRGDQAQQGDGS